MTRRIFSIGLIVGLLCATSSLSYAQNAAETKPASLDACRNAINTQLAIEQRRHRAVLYGYPTADEAPVGFVRYAAPEGTPWIKVDEDNWQTPEQASRADDEWNNQTDLITPRRGLFATKGVLTSAIIPPALQSMRAMQCGADTICWIARSSANVEESESVAQPIEDGIQAPGCLPVAAETLPACHFALDSGKRYASKDVFSYCENVADQMIEREADLLRVAVEYDAAYRSLLQLAGTLDLFVEQLRWPLLNTMRQAVALMGQFSRIPCFTASCDDFPDPLTNADLVRP